MEDLELFHINAPWTLKETCEVVGFLFYFVAFFSEPESVPLKVDGENDMCSKQEDINFKFTGFSIYGNVS